MVSWNPATLQHLIPVFQPALTVIILTRGKVSICEKVDQLSILADRLPDAVFVRNRRKSEGIRQSES